MLTVHLCPLSCTHMLENLFPLFVRCKWTLAQKLTWPLMENDISFDSVCVDKTIITPFSALFLTHLHLPSSPQDFTHLTNLCDYGVISAGLLTVSTPSKSRSKPHGTFGGSNYPL